jgi:DNA invertase Pin-like site-specific DNA recombinase
MSRKSHSAPLAYSYVRFSSSDQAKGDSLRRQTEAAEEWCRRNGVGLDSSTTLHDLGRSAYTGSHRANPDRNALAAFLQLVEGGKVPRGSYLVIENLDRLSREHIQPALLLVLNLLQAGVRIVQLKPSEIVFDDKSDTLPVMMMMVELSRGHGESAMKSERIGKAWAQKKRAAADGKVPMTSSTPSWLRLQKGAFVVDEEKAAAVRRIFRMATDGQGMGLITKRLNAEGVPPISGAAHWSRSYVCKLLSNRAVFGEFQPHSRRGGRRRPDGAPVPGYYPPVISEDEFHATQAALKSRTHKGGRPTARLNLFGGLMRDARTGGSLIQRNKQGPTGGGRLFLPALADGIPGCRIVSFPVVAFEEAILSMLREIDPREVLPKRDNATDRVLSLTGKLAGLEGRVEKLRAELVDGGDLAPLVEALRELEAKRLTTAEQLAAAKREAASPASEAWGECRTLLDTLKESPDQDDARLRLRSAIRRIVDSIWCLFMGRGLFRIAAVQLWFRGDGHRDYLIVYRQPLRGPFRDRPAKLWKLSESEGAALGSLDFRKRADARKLERALADMDLSKLE